MESSKESISAEKKRTALKYKVIVFLITAFLYAALHSTRTCWAYSKPAISENINFSKYYFGVLDSCFLTAYAVGLYLSGWLGDRVGLKYLLTLGLISAALSFASFALIEGLLKERSLYLDSFAFIIDGLGQSTGFPVCVAILSNWFSSKEKGLVFGIWLTNINIGNILGQQIGKAFLDLWNINWVYVIYSTSFLVIFFTVITVYYLPIEPSEVGLANIKDSHPKHREFSRLISNEMNEREEEKKSSSGDFIKAIKTPGVLIYSAVFFCVKAASYGLLFWLPSYLKFDLGLHEETATLLAYNELGSLVGVILLGMISDKIKDRSKTITYGLSYSVILFLLISIGISKDQLFILSILLFLIGIGIGGSSGLIGGAISSDLGEQNGNNSIATITGFIDGTGTVGAAVAQMIIPLFGSHSFLFYTGITLLAAIMTPIARKQIHKIKRVDSAKNYEIEVISSPLPQDASFSEN